MGNSPLNNDDTLNESRERGDTHTHTETMARLKNVISHSFLHHVVAGVKAGYHIYCTYL